MAKLDTRYLGLQLRNPIIVSSSGLSNTIKKIEKLARFGAGAIVLKSIFEEQIRMEANSMLKGSDYPEALDYISNYASNNAVENYLQLITDAKARVDIPILASINCISSSGWQSFAKNMEEAGADALELNVYYLPTSVKESSKTYEDLYISILTSIRKTVSIPVSIKLGLHFTNLPGFINSLKASGANGVVLFNRFYAPDIDLESLSFTTSDVFSSPADIRYSLRWVGITSSLIPNLDVCASTGIHNANGAIKQILAGAKAVQICSTLYKNGPEYLQNILTEMNSWMEKHNFADLHEMRGRMSYKNIPDPAIFERAQFMKYFSSFV
jgi:dihydroorotate dehydrogenase (fumarate)